MNATIQQIHRDRGTGSLVAEDGKTYMFRRNSVRDGWFHDLSEGATVTFEPADPASIPVGQVVPEPAALSLLLAVCGLIRGRRLLHGRRARA